MEQGFLEAKNRNVPGPLSLVPAALLRWGDDHLSTYPRPRSRGLIADSAYRCQPFMFAALPWARAGIR